jgi:hypothetical protein
VANKWVLKQRLNNAIVAKAKGLATIDPNVVYDVLLHLTAQHSQLLLMVH